ncbi:MAG TPA: diguanylate cyclase [Candidatus Baltobacteraceae bacterium]|nr:diguanylate cyclase [Candidatus Baltobacteraceae bacterium]
MPTECGMSEQEQAIRSSHGETPAANRRSDLLSDVVEHAPDAIFVFEAAPPESHDWRVVYANTAFESLYGTPSPAGRSLLGFLGARASPGDVARTVAGLNRMAAFRTPPMRRRASGTPVWIETNYQPKIEPDRILWFAVSRNVTLSMLLAQRSRQLSRALDEAQEAIAVSTAHRRAWRIDYVNRAFIELLGYEADELVGQSWRKLFARETNFKQIEDYRVALLSGQRIQGEQQFRRKDGTVILLSLSATPFRVEGAERALSTVTTLRDVTSTRREEQWLREQALRDPLTGLHNRREFERLLRASIDMTPPGGHAHVMMFIDLDDFKRVNDTEGHDAGDRVLIAVSETLRRTLLPSDDLARWGGDEFAAILYFCAPAQAVSRGNDLLRALAGSPECRGVGASIGIVRIEHALLVEELMRRADRLVYKAKAAGRNRVIAADAGAH